MNDCRCWCCKDEIEPNERCLLIASEFICMECIRYNAAEVFTGLLDGEYTTPETEYETGYEDVSESEMEERRYLYVC